MVFLNYNTTYFNQLRTSLLTQAYESLNCHSYIPQQCAKGKFHNCQTCNSILFYLERGLCRQSESRVKLGLSNAKPRKMMCFVNLKKMAQISKRFFAPLSQQSLSFLKTEKRKKNVQNKNGNKDLCYDESSRKNKSPPPNRMN